MSPRSGSSYLIYYILLFATCQVKLFGSRTSKYSKLNIKKVPQAARTTHNPGRVSCILLWLGHLAFRRVPPLSLLGWDRSLAFKVYALEIGNTSECGSCSTLRSRDGHRQAADACPALFILSKE